MSSEWSHEDEMQLLSALLEHGFGNWQKISKKVTNHEAEECERYYMSKFIYTTDPIMKKILELHPRKEGLCSDNCKIHLPFNENLKNHSFADVIETEKCINRLSFDFQKQGTSEDINVTAIPDSVSPFANFLKNRKVPFFNDLPGYNPNRSDFELEFDDKAESLLALLHEEPGVEEENIITIPEDEDFINELKLALVNAYNFRLSERIRRKEIIRKHALLDRRKTFGVLHRYQNVFGKRQLISLMTCMRFLTGPEMDFLLEQLQYQKDLKVKINKLSSYRKLGIKYLDSVPLYEKLFRKRIKCKHELETNAAALDFGMRYQKRVSAPLVLHHLPGYNLLEDDEKELCSTSRIVPETYLSFKKLMIQECQRLNGLKLAQARPLFKIDVNKTRKMYDYLMLKKLIWVPS